MLYCLLARVQGKLDLPGVVLVIATAFLDMVFRRIICLPQPLYGEALQYISQTICFDEVSYRHSCNSQVKTLKSLYPQDGGFGRAVQRYGRHHEQSSIGRQHTWLHEVTLMPGVRIV